ncbi:hypothetical protein ACN28S_25505 [Cystobacter fuscus]
MLFTKVFSWPMQSKWLLLAVPIGALLCISCSAAPRVTHGSSMRLPPLHITPFFQPSLSWGPPPGAHSRLNQSCGAACAAPVGPSTGEIVAPTATRLRPVAEKAVQAIKAAEGLLRLERALTGAELDRLEGILKECVSQAHADINKDYQQQDGGFKFKNGKFPSDAECNRAMGFTESGDPITMAQQLGTLKHAAAFACLKTRLSKEFGDNFSIEPRYKGKADSSGITLTTDGPGSLVPDVVVHATRNATDIQCVYEFKFPCHESRRLSPITSSGVKEQLKGYQRLTRRCPVALITPGGLWQWGID